MANDFSFKLNPDDMKLVSKIKASMEKVQGSVPVIAAIRKAIRDSAAALS